MNFSFYLAQRLTLKSKRTFSKLIVRMSVLAIALGVAVMILSMAIVKGFKQEIREKVRAFSGDVQVLKNDLNFSLENSSFSLPKSVLEELKSDSSLLSVQAFATKPGIIKVNNEIEGVVLKGIDDSYSAKSIQSIMVSGRSINFADTVQAQKEILISTHTARLLHVKVGDDFVMYFVQEPLRKRKFTVVGVYNLGVDEVDNSYVIGSLSLIRRLNNWSDSQVGGYEIRLKDFKRMLKEEEKIFNNLESKIKKIDLNPQIIIPAGQKTASFNISGIDDISYESTETISITPSVIGGTLASADPFSLNLTSDDAIPSIKLSADNLILDENGGSLQVNVVLTDASGATGFWVNSDYLKMLKVITILLESIKETSITSQNLAHHGQ